MQICWTVMVGGVLQVLATVRVSLCQLSERDAVSLLGPSHIIGTVYIAAIMIILLSMFLLRSVNKRQSGLDPV